MSLEISNKSDILEENNFTEQAGKIIEKLDGTLDTELIANLLKNIDNEFPEDDAFFLLNILTEKYPEILDTYCKSNLEKKDEIIFKEIVKIIDSKHICIENDSINLVINEDKLDIGDTDYGRSKGKKITQTIEFEKNVYYTKKEFFEKLPKDLQDDLLEKLEGKNKEEIQKIVMELEENYKKAKKVLSNNNIDSANFWSFITSILIYSMGNDLETSIKYGILTWLGTYLFSKKVIQSPKGYTSFDSLEILIEKGDIRNGLKKLIEKNYNRIKGILDTIRV